MAWNMFDLYFLQPKIQQCSVCKGEKTIPNDEPIPSAPIITCPHCKGTGVEPEKKQKSSPFEEDGFCFREE